jgi:FlgN protein
VSLLHDHLDRQLGSSRRLLEIVLNQSAAIRRQDVATVLASLGDVQAEMGYRAQLEVERARLLTAVAQRRGLEVSDVDLETVLLDLPSEEADEARAMSAELVGLVKEIGRIHDQNRVLLRQELTFLDHLMRALSGTPQGGYSPAGWVNAPTTMSTVDARA